MDIAIIGAGITGLTAAYDLTRAGHRVTVYEARPYAGGLASGFHDERWEWPLERFYHHWFASDREAISLIRELGVADRLFFPRPTTSIYHRGRIYPFDSPMRVLRFTPLPIQDRLRVGVVTLYLRLLRRWEPLEAVTAEEWTRRAVGPRAYEILWKPLLISKFGPDEYRHVNMAWFWARLHKRTPRLGYFVGGFQGFIDVLVERVTAQGGRILLNAPVRRIRRNADRQTGDGADANWTVEYAGGWETHEAVIATCPPGVLADLAPDLPADYGARLRALKSLGAVTLVLALRHPLTRGHYWINLPKGDEFPFMGLVEHTNYISPDHYGGDHIVYCGRLPAAGPPHFRDGQGGPAGALLARSFAHSARHPPRLGAGSLDVRRAVCPARADVVPLPEHPAPADAAAGPLDGEHEPGLPLGPGHQLRGGTGAAGGEGDRET
jgi:protoporphyrinogen oxidase